MKVPETSPLLLCVKREGKKEDWTRQILKSVPALNSRNLLFLRLKCPDPESAHCTSVLLRPFTAPPWLQLEDSLPKQSFPWVHCPEWLQACRDSAQYGGWGLGARASVASPPSHVPCKYSFLYKSGHDNSWEALP